MLYKRGFSMLTLGWTDGYSFVPVGFNLLSFAKKSNRYQEISDGIDHRSNGYKARKEAPMKKTDAAVLLVRRALQAGIRADYVLMDTWFTTEPMIHALLAEGIRVKIVFVRNCNKSSECLYILSTECSLSVAGIVRIYGNCFSCFAMIFRTWI